MEVAAHKAMVEKPVGASIVGDNFCIVTRANHAAVAVEDNVDGVVLKHRLTIGSKIRAKQAGRAADDDTIGTLSSIAAGTSRAKQVVITIALMDVSSLHLGTSYLKLVSARLHREAIGTQFDAIDAAEATPEEILMTIIIDIEWVNTVLDTYLVTEE